MARSQNPNLEVLRLAIKHLGELADEFVFVGGCATGLLITDSAAPPIRPTFDVDAIVELSSKAEYYRLSKMLRQRGFKEDTRKGAPLCRWVIDTLVLDVMPTDAKIIGFSNPWYAAAVTSAQETKLPSGETLRLISAPYFLITKLAAFNGRGNKDYQMSHDLEDLIAVVDGRKQLINEVDLAPGKLKQALVEQIAALLNDQSFIDALPGHMPGDSSSQQRVPGILSNLRAIVEVAKN